MRDPPFTIGIEEEYLVVERATLNLAADPAASMLEACQARLRDQVSPEFMRSQIEVGTPVCATMAEARRELARLRREVAEVAADHGYAIIAAATHPFAVWSEQLQTHRKRYQALAKDLQTPARRMLICGMHVHVGLGDDETRIEMLNQVSYFLPHLLALSASSPFWQGEPTGLRSYRISVFDEMPRTGLPEQFASYSEYQRHVAVLIDAGIIEDASKIWWDVRPSARFPTLEMRICDMPTRMDDTLTIAALYVCVLRMLWRLRRNNQRWRAYANMLISENRWRAQRYGVDEGLIDFGRGEIVPYADLLEEVIALVAEDAEALGCARDVANARDILKRGASAHNQSRVYDQALAAGASRDEALRAVVDWLIEETLRGVPA